MNWEVRVLFELDRLVSPSDIAERLGVSMPRASQMINQQGFPEPIKRVGRTRLYDIDEVIAWRRPRDPAVKRAELVRQAIIDLQAELNELEN
jgi:predicted DNA-binding transcriptional regulator AlpA